jgi:hypothetical protein
MRAEVEMPVASDREFERYQIHKSRCDPQAITGRVVPIDGGEAKHIDKD